MGHEFQDAVSMEVAQRIAAELPRRPEWIAHARANLDRWSRLNREAPSLLRCYAEWRSILDRPVEQVCEALLSPTDTGQRLRQNTPFSGILTPQEVWEIKRRRRHDKTSA